MSEPRDGEYVALLRSRLPDDAHKARMRARLAAAGVGATLAAGSAQAAVGKAAAWKLSLASKLFLAVGSVAVLGGSAYLATTATERPRVARTVIVPAQRDAAAAEPPATEPTVAPVVAKPAPVAKPRRPRAVLDTLSAENELLAAAVRALNAGDSVEAVRLLDEHERRHPNGLLRDERERARRRLLTP